MYKYIQMTSNNTADLKFQDAPRAIKNSRIYYINSRNRIGGTNENFQYKIEMNPLIDNFNHACVLQASIPKSYYLVQDKHNTFTLREDLKEATITITPGNYTYSTIMTEIVDKLNSSSPSGWTYSCSFTKSTGKFTFTVSNNADIQPSFVFDIHLYEVFGFEKNSTNVFNANSLTSTNIINLQLETTLYIISDLVETRGKNVLQEIFVSSSPDLGHITYLCRDVMAYSKKLSTNKSNIYKFVLTNEDDEVMNLNGINMVFSLLLYEA